MRTKAAIKAAAVLVALFATTTKADYETDLYNLSHLIYGEAAGCSYDMMLSVGSVALNRVADDRFPDTLAEVIWQEGQYSCTWDGNFYREPSEDAIRAAAQLLEDGPAIDEAVVWQAEFIQGRLYDAIESPWGTTMYFCY